MAGVVAVALYTGSLLALVLFLVGALRYELEMGVFLRSVLAVSVAAVGLMVALPLAVPFLRSFGALADVV